MKNKKNILILNTGGTFHKEYNPIDGSLEIKKNNHIVEDIFKRSKLENITLEGILYKDSLDIDDEDRVSILQLIEKSQYKKIVIIHGTDTIDQTAQYLANHIQDKQIVLTGAMVPYSIDKVEATANLMLGYGYLLGCKKNNIYIAMHGKVKKYNKIKKNKQLGVFECQ